MSERTDQFAIRSRDGGVELSGPQPFLYVLLIDAPDAPLTNQPVVRYAVTEDFASTTFPHQFDRALEAVLPGVAYILNLPRAPMDLLNVKDGEYFLNRPDWHFHTIYVMPAHNPHALPTVPTLIIAPDHLLQDAQRLSSERHALLAPCALSQLSASLAGQHWRELWTATCSQVTGARFVAPSAFVDSFETIATELPSVLKRLCVGDDGNRRVARELSVVIPGVAPHYEQLLEEIRGPRRESEVLADRQIEQRVFTLLGAHSALRYFGRASLLATLPPPMFDALGRYEAAARSRRPSARTIWSALDDMTALGKAWLDGPSRSALAEAQRIKAFSNFPFGLLGLDDASVPLGLATPTAIVPLNALTQNFMYQLRTVPKIRLAGKTRIHVVECIPEYDPAGRISREMTRRLMDGLRRHPQIAIDTSEALSVEALRTTLDETFREIVVISAHGEHRSDPHVAGIYCGTEFTTGAELNTVSPVVILSSCEVSPGGIGSPSIVSEFLNHGALVVAGTLTPIGVVAHGYFLERLFSIVAQYAGDDHGATFLDAWSSSLRLCSAFDVAASDAATHEALFDRSQESQQRMARFLRGFVGRIDAQDAYVYQAAIDSLVELGLRGPSRDFRDFVVPESLSYTIYGWPENIAL